MRFQQDQGSESSEDESEDESVNQIEESPYTREVFTINNGNQESTTELKVMVSKEKNQISYLTGLLDTGASGCFIKQTALEKVHHHLENATVQLQGRYNSSMATNIATFSLKLPDFTMSREVKVRAYVEVNASGKHDIILGRTFCKQIGLKFDFEKKTVT